MITHRSCSCSETTDCFCSKHKTLFLFRNKTLFWFRNHPKVLGHHLWGIFSGKSPREMLSRLGRFISRRDFPLGRFISRRDFPDGRDIFRYLRWMCSAGLGYPRWIFSERPGDLAGIFFHPAVLSSGKARRGRGTIRGALCEANAAGLPPPPQAHPSFRKFRERCETPGVPHLSTRFAGMPPPQKDPAAVWDHRPARAH